jgi:asparagine synthase (glutamine-hydrolysing)
LAQILERWLPAAKRSKHWAYKLQTLSDILSTRSPEEIYWKMISQWKRTDDVVYNTHEPLTVLNDSACHARLPDFEHRMMYLDTVSYLPDDILTKVDRAAMSVSLETRLPLLDHRVVEFAWRLPLRFKMHQQGKWILRKVLYRYVPKELVDRPKMGFGLPLGEWLRGPLKSWGEALIEPRRLLREGVFSPKAIQRRWHEHQAGVRDWSYSLWNVLMFQSWLETQE